MCQGASDFEVQHETGHDIWFHQLTEKQRSDYTKAYNRDIKRGKEYFFREYSMQSAVEDFADNYALRKYKYNKKLNSRMKMISGYVDSK